MQHRFAGGDEYAEHTAAVMASPVEVEQVGMALTPLVDADGGDWDGFDQIGVSILAEVLDGDGFFSCFLAFGRVTVRVEPVGDGSKVLGPLNPRLAFPLILGDWLRNVKIEYRVFGLF